MQDDAPATLRLFGMATIVLCLACAALAAPLLYQQYQVLKTWTPAFAEVADSTVVAVNTAPGHEQYQAQYLLSYRVGSAIWSTTVRPGRPSGSRAAAQAEADRFAVGSRVPIVYYPLSPRQIRMEPGFNRRFLGVPFVIGGAALGFLVIGMGLLWGARRKRPA